MLDISVSAPLDKDQIKQELGSDLGADIIVVRLTARPVSDKPVQLSLDDFLLVSGKDGQRSEPFEPGQLAGSDSLIGDAERTERTGRPSDPRSESGDLESVAVFQATHPPPDLKVQESRDEKANPLLAALNAKILPEKQITEPISGLLVFQMVGKVKAKDLELHYKGPAGPMALRFRPEK